MQSEYPPAQYFEFQSLRLAYYRFDPERKADVDEAPVLWLHANGYPALTYTPLLRRLAASGRTVYALDFVAHGNSAEPDHEFKDWFYFRDQALALLGHLGHPRVRLVGHSLGGASALLTAAALETTAAPGSGPAPAVVESLCLLDPTVITPLLVHLLAFLPNPMARAAENRRRVFKSLKIVARSYRMHPAFADWRKDVFEAYLRYALRARDDGQYELVLPPAVEARIFRTLKAGHWPHHRRVSAPLLVLQAAKSQVCPDRSAKILTGRHPASRSGRHENGSHFFPMEHPDWTVDRILEFFEGVDNAAT